MTKTDIHPYVLSGVIAYIGNKRKLLPLIDQALADITGGSAGGLRFADLFSGSGVVARFARYKGMLVSANDWEPYAGVLGKAWLEPDERKIKEISAKSGFADGMDGIFKTMNSLEDPPEHERYLSKYYSALSNDRNKTDFRKERLFYTRENALKLDAARNYIDKLTDRVKHVLSSEELSLFKAYLLAPVIYEAATHVNTSGVFKAYHHGFGGYGRDALNRITSGVYFEIPLIINRVPGKMYTSDALELVKSGAVSGSDIVYLDPPYNQHQYGSNYHLLNTIVMWDRIPEPLELGEDGSLKRKAAIRKDWVKTRSDYCYASSAENAFSGLLENLDAENLIISYSTDGIIPINRLIDISQKYGRVRLIANPYITYRGGRQSSSRKNKNLEFLLVVEKGRAASRTDRKAISRVLKERKLHLLSSMYLDPASAADFGVITDSQWIVQLPDYGNFTITLKCLISVEPLSGIDQLSGSSLDFLIEVFEKSVIENKEEEIKIICSLWESGRLDCPEIIKRLPVLLRKLAYKKYSEQFIQSLEKIRKAGASKPASFKKIETGINKIEQIYKKRTGKTF